MEINWYVAGLKKHQSSEFYDITKLIEHGYSKFDPCKNSLLISFGDGTASVPDMHNYNNKVELHDKEYICYAEVRRPIKDKMDQVVINNKYITKTDSYCMCILAIALSDVLRVHYMKYLHNIPEFKGAKINTVYRSNNDLAISKVEDYLVNNAFDKYLAYKMYNEAFDDNKLSELVINKKESERALSNALRNGGAQDLHLKHLASCIVANIIEDDDFNSLKGATPEFKENIIAFKNILKVAFENVLNQKQIDEKAYSKLHELSNYIVTFVKNNRLLITNC